MSCDSENDHSSRSADGPDDAPERLVRTRPNSMLVGETASASATWRSPNPGDRSNPAPGEATGEPAESKARALILLGSHGREYLAAEIGLAFMRSRCGGGCSTTA